MYKRRVVSVVLETSLPTIGPGISALRIFIVVPGASLKKATTNTKIPIPPIQCEKLRQNRAGWLNASISIKIEEPV